MTQYLKTFLLTSCLVAVASCSDETKSPNTNPGGECEDADCEDGSDEESTDDEDTTGLLDGGKGMLDASKPAPSKDGGASDASTAKDAGKTTDASVGIDAAVEPTQDAGNQDAGKVDAGKVDAGKDAGKVDAGSEPEEDAGSEPAQDAGSRTDSGTAPSGTCGGSTPHGCFVAESDNIPGCPAVIPEVPALISPFVDRPSCDRDIVAAIEVCSYSGPTGIGDRTGLANCVCDASERWLCIYPD